MKVRVEEEYWCRWSLLGDNATWGTELELPDALVKKFLSAERRFLKIYRELEKHIDEKIKALEG